MKWDFTRRFGFLVNDVAKLYGENFDRLAREHIGLSRAQCRMLGVLAAREGKPALSQTELARELGLTTMAVGSMCDRMAQAGWIRRESSPVDRRINRVHLEPSASKALDGAMRIGDTLTQRALSALTPAERQQLHALLGKAREGLLAQGGAVPPESQEDSE